MFGVRTYCSPASLAFVLASVPALAVADEVRYFDVPKGDRPHDVAPAPDGTVWYTGQVAGVLGRLDPKSGEVERIPLGQGSRPHGVIVGPDGAAWVTDAGLNAILRVDPASKEVKSWQLPKERADANLNTAAFDGAGRIWFTGQSGIYGRLDPKTGGMTVWDAPRGRGPYGITATPSGQIWFVSLAGSYLARPYLESGEVEVIEPPKKGSGPRRVWSDSKGRPWVSEWNAGSLSVYDSEKKTWQSWRLPGEIPRAYAVYVDDADKVWVSDFPGNAILRFDPKTEKFESFPSDRENANVRQMLGRPGETWGAESGTDRLVVIRRAEAAN
ncbi:MAG TPA: lyase [Alphaproteobacteria bacterium]|nr:lyase [Alphaproteobacteria bacterium]